LAIKPAAPGGHRPDERVVHYQLTARIRGARQAMTEPDRYEEVLEQVYAHSRGSARTYLDDYYRANSPFGIAKT
jgi:type IV secretory pathway TrbF-like protein